ncbi:PriCT-2 domain-containing protein [Halonotius roseus]|uniref:Winged helix-turn-helix transcriptional regulator n=1 Tax=Halonotius roseus TaxID=2511997 RepID=A0A544QQX1_9EURY|nr:PriCT-2 domain-containing protein [Halonotius roseus]TQQ81836.1 winged helix-turn-helix transcriptional regulator [Halonotius roseus]
MSSAVDRLTREQWATLLDEVEPRTFYQLVDAVDDSLTIDPNAEAVVETAIDEGVLVVDTEASGNFEYFRLNDASTLECSTDNEDHDTTLESNLDESGSNDDNPGCDSGRTLQAAATAALDDAVRWFNQRIDDEILDHTEHGDHNDRPTTAREWFAENRRFDDATIDDKRLGWAPADGTDRLIEHLTTRGHSQEAIKATGLFTDDLRLLWRGRYVFPYFDEDGRAAYAIARATGGLGGGAAGYDGHPRDFIAGKYAKLAHTKEYAAVEEPIFGLSTLDRDGPVVITEGVADAIRAHEYGYTCLSPVTTQFKKEHREQLAEILKDSGRRTYIVQDAERPVVEHTDEVDGWDALGLEQYGEGVKGAARTAAFLAEEGIDAYLAELPRLGLDKVDLDDYLADWSDDLGSVLAGAKPGSQHPAYEAATLDDEGESGEWDADSYGDGGGYGADLTEEEVAAALDYVSTTLSYDDWIQLGYAVHAWNDGAKGRRLFAEWSRRSPKWSEPESPNAIEWIWNNAIAGGEVTVGTLIARAKEGGWEPLQHGEDGEPEAALPLERLDALDREEARRYASKRGVEWPTTREARERLRNKIMDIMHHGDMKVIDAPTALGKSYTVATEPWLRRSSTTGDAPVVQFSETREARDQAAGHSADAGVEAARLLGRSEACPVAAGAHDPAGEDENEPEVVITMNGQPANEWFEAVCDGDGVPFSVAHTYLDDHNDQDADLPCCDGEGECPAIAQWDGLPRNDDGDPAVDVIHATHGFAHVPSLRNGTNMVFDEEPDFSVELSHERVRNAVAAYLKVADAPVTDYERFVARARKGEDEPANEHSENQYIRDALDYEPDREWYLEADGSHTLAPALTKAIYCALRPEEGGTDADASDANGRYNATVGHEPPRLDKEANDAEGWNRVWVSVVLDEDNTVRTVRSTPDTMAARSVIGLDAHPCVEKWQRNAHPDIMPQPVLSPDERRLWRRFERGLSVVGVGDATRPLTSGEYFDEDGTRAFLQSLRDHYGDRFRTAITAASVEHRTEELLEEVGVDEPNTMHYGEEKSRGDFGDEDVGALNGCIDPGDDFVLDLLAEAGLEATPETNTNDDGEEYRAKGRGFEGPDADAAERLLASVRENHVAQAAGRYARNADDSDDEAVVFVRTDAVPDGYLDLTVPGVEWIATDRQREIIGELRRRPTATTREIADATGNSKEHVRQTLERLEEADLVECREHAGDHGAHIYRALAGLGEGDLVELTPTTNDGVCNSYTWSLAVSRPETEFRARTTTATPESTSSPSKKPSEQLELGAGTNVDPPN